VNPPLVRAGHEPLPVQLPVHVAGGRQIDGQAAWNRTISRPRWRIPRFPVQAPRSGIATMSPAGVTRLRSGLIVCGTLVG